MITPYIIDLLINTTPAMHCGLAKVKHHLKAAAVERIYHAEKKFINVFFVTMGPCQSIF